VPLLKGLMHGLVSAMVSWCMVFLGDWVCSLCIKACASSIVILFCHSYIALF
jgi:hypothetical protein